MLFIGFLGSWGKLQLTTKSKTVPPNLITFRLGGTVFLYYVGVTD